MEEKCNFCGAGGAGIWSDGHYEALRCGSCGVIWVSPRPAPEDLQEIYSRDYFEKWYIKYEKERKAYFRRELAEIERVIGSAGIDVSAGKKLLDVGCGTGFFLEAARERGWDGEGVEISNFAAGYVRDKLGFNVYAGSLKDLDARPGEFDLVTMWDVLAHVDDPAGYLEKTGFILKSGGLLVIKTPDHPPRLFALAGLANFTGRSKGLLHIPAQIFHFEPGNISNLLKKHGFSVIRTQRVREVLSGGWTSSGLKNFLAAVFHDLLKLTGAGESFVVYAKKGTVREDLRRRL